MAAVLAGGAGRRMGAPKTTTPLRGRPLISYPIDAARAAGLDVVVMTKPSTPLPELDVEVWLEPPRPRHPLAGIVTALERAGGRPVLALGCDLPLLTPDLLAWLAALAEGAEAVVPMAAGRPQPLLARYSAAALDPLRRALASEQALTAAITTLAPLWVQEPHLARFGDPARLTFNVNTPADLERAAELLLGPP